MNCVAHWRAYGVDFSLSPSQARFALLVIPLSCLVGRGGDVFVYCEGKGPGLPPSVLYRIPPQRQ